MAYVIGWIQTAMGRKHQFTTTHSCSSMQAHVDVFSLDVVSLNKHHILMTFAVSMKGHCLKQMPHSVCVKQYN